MADSDAAHGLGQLLVQAQVLHHVVDAHQFRAEELFYRFRADDDTEVVRDSRQAALVTRAIRIWALQRLSSHAIQDRQYGLTTYRSCLVGKDLVTWLVDQQVASTRAEAVEFGRDLVRLRVLSHVCNDHDFKDELLFYHFAWDQLEAAKDAPLITPAHRFFAYSGARLSIPGPLRPPKPPQVAAQASASASAAISTAPP